jgi:hypothetical protein
LIANGVNFIFKITYAPEKKSSTPHNGPNQCIDNERGSMTRMKVIMATRTTMNPKRGIQEGQKDG